MNYNMAKLKQRMRSKKYDSCTFMVEAAKKLPERPKPYFDLDSNSKYTIKKMCQVSTYRIMKFQFSTEN